MISNYHTASSGPAYYTLSSADVKGSAGNSSPGGKRTHRRRWGRGRVNSSDTTSEESNAVVSLSYSAGSSNQSAGESTDSSQFSDILRVLDVEDKKELSKLERKLLTERAQHGQKGAISIHSAASSLNYSDTDGESTIRGIERAKLTRGLSNNSAYSTDYSTDQESQLEGSKLLQGLSDDPISIKMPHSPARLLGNESASSDEDPFDMLFQPAATPNYRATGQGSSKSKNANQQTEASKSEATPLVTPTNKSTVVATVTPSPSKSSASKSTQDGAMTATATSPAAPVTNATPVVRTSSKSSQGGKSQASREPSSSSRKSDGKEPTDANSSQQDESSSTAGLGQHRSFPQARKRSNNNKNINNKKSGGDGFEDVWTCGARLLDDALPPKVKTVLRPFLCGVV